MEPVKRNVTRTQAMRILKKQGVEINEEEAGLILDLMYKIATIAADQYLRQ